MSQSGTGFREEVINVGLAELLSQYGIVSVPERIIQSATKRRLPDVIVTFNGLRTIIEGKVDDHPTAAAEVLGNAQGRVETGLAHIAIGVLYPLELRQAKSYDHLKQLLPGERLRMAICSEAGNTGWDEGNLEYLASLLRRTFAQLVSEDVVARAVSRIEDGINCFTTALASVPGAIERFGPVLGVGEEISDQPTEQENEQDV